MEDASTFIAENLLSFSPNPELYLLSGFDRERCSCNCLPARRPEGPLRPGPSGRAFESRALPVTDRGSPAYSVTVTQEAAMQVIRVSTVTFSLAWNES